MTRILTAAMFAAALFPAGCGAAPAADAPAEAPPVAPAQAWGPAPDGVVTPPPTICTNPPEGMLACAAGYIGSAPDRVTARAEVFGWEPHGTGFRKCDGTYCWYRTRADFAG